jgi:GT2 family glycosyltransferase
MNATFENTCIVYSTIDANAPHVPVLRASLEAYAPLPIFRAVNIGDYGYSYNALHHDARGDQFEYVIHSNDDVVLRPDTIERLFEDAAHLNSAGIKWAWLAARTDWVRHSAQNIRFPYENKALGGIFYPEEQLIVEVSSVSPIFAITKAADFLPYAPINWFSDDEQCYRMTKSGYRHFVSRAYVHHVGSQTMKPETWQAEQAASIEYLRQHNPEFLEAYGIK